MPRTRRMGMVLLAGSLLLLAGLAVRHYQLRGQGAPAGSGSAVWILGPPAETLDEAARQRMSDGMERINDPTLPPNQRIGEYRASLREAERLLVESLRAQPSQPRVIARLAAVRWELDPPLTAEARDEILDLIELAGRQAPRMPDVHQHLGTLLLRMGRVEEGLDYLIRAVELAPKRSEPVIEILGHHLVRAEEMLRALPHHPETLAALAGPFFEEERGEAYVAALEPYLDGNAAAIVILAYGNACLGIGRPGRLRDALDPLPALRDPDAEAQRRLQLARARAALDDPAGVVRDLAAGRALKPADSVYQERAGKIALQAGEASAALEAFREALAIAARQASTPEWRALLYRRTGEALELQGQPDLAYDAYRQSLALNPDERMASRRLDELRRAAGLGGR